MFWRTRDWDFGEVLLHCLLSAPRTELNLKPSCWLFNCFELIELLPRPRTSVWLMVRKKTGGDCSYEILIYLYENCSTWCGSSEERCGLKTLPAVLNTLSDCTLISGHAKNWKAKPASIRHRITQLDNLLSWQVRLHHALSRRAMWSWTAASTAKCCWDGGFLMAL